MKKIYVLRQVVILLMSLAAPMRMEAIQFNALPDTSDRVIHSREVYKTIDTFNLRIDIFCTEKTSKGGSNPAIIFFHGGGWAYGKPDEFFSTCQRYARLGFVSFSVEYRLSNDKGKVPLKGVSAIESLMDARSAIRYVKGNAERFHIDKSKIVAAGQSAGGQLVLSTAMIDEYNDRTDDLRISCRPDAILLFSSCVNTLEGWCDLMLGERRDKIWSISPFHHVKSGLPPMIEFHGTYDDQVPVWTLRYFANEMEKAGNYFELHLFEGKRHYLGDGNPKYSNYFDDDILKTTDEFLRKFNFLK